MDFGNSCNSLHFVILLLVSLGDFYTIFCNTTLFYKNILYKKTKAQFANNIKPLLEHAELQGKILKSTPLSTFFLSTNIF